MMASTLGGVVGVDMLWMYEIKPYVEKKIQIGKAYSIKYIYTE